MGNLGLPIVCFDARHESCPLDANWKKRVFRKPISTKVVGWHLYKKGNKPSEWLHHEKCGCYKRNKK